MIVANALELWARLSMPGGVVTGYDYFKIVAQGVVCVLLTGLLMVCVVYNVELPRDEMPSVCPPRPVEPVEVAESPRTIWLPPLAGSGAPLFVRVNRGSRMDRPS